jgi:hypothetical protein
MDHKSKEEDIRIKANTANKVVAEKNKLVEEENKVVAERNKVIEEISNMKSNRWKIPVGFLIIISSVMRTAGV